MTANIYLNFRVFQTAVPLNKHTQRILFISDSGDTLNCTVALVPSAGLIDSVSSELEFVIILNHNKNTEIDFEDFDIYVNWVYSSLNCHLFKGYCYLSTVIECFLASWRHNARKPLDEGIYTGGS